MTISQGSPSRSPRRISRLAVLVHQPLVFSAGNLPADRPRRYRTDVRCVVRTSSLPRISRTPTRRCCAFLKLCRIGSTSSAPRQRSASSRSSDVETGQLVQHQRVHQLVDHARIAGQDSGQIGTGRAQLHVQSQRRRVEAEQLPQHALAAQRVADFAEVDQRRIGIGRGGDRLEQVGRDGGQEVAAAPRGEKRDLLRGQCHQVVIGALGRREIRTGRGIGESDSERRVRVQHQIDFRRPSPGRRRRRRAAGDRGSGDSIRSCLQQILL